MSTKIHHGYRLAAGVDVFDFQTRLRHVMNPVRDRLEAAHLMAAAVTAVDVADLAGGPRPGEPLVDAFHEFDDQQRSIAKAGYFQAVSSKDFDPYSFEVSFGVDVDHDGGPRVLCLLFAEDSAYRDAFEELPEVEPYGYWNNTDQPGDVTELEWEQRREAWDRVVGHLPPAETMLTFQLRGLYNPSMLKLAASSRDDSTAALLAAAAPSWEARVQSRMRQLLAEQAPRTEPVDVSAVVSMVWEVHRVVGSTSAGDVAQLADLRRLTEAVLDPDVSGYVLQPGPGATSRSDVSRETLRADAARVYAALFD